MVENSILAGLTFQPDEGALRFKEVRYLLIRPETLAAFQQALEAEVGLERAGELLFAGGFAGGQLSGQKYKETFGLNDQEAAAFMCRMGGEIGWGAMTLELLDSQQRRLVVTVAHSPFAEAYLPLPPLQGGEKGPSLPLPQRGGIKGGVGVCHLIRGVMGGLAAGLFGVAVEAREVECAAYGSPVCRFEVQGQ